MPRTEDELSLAEDLLSRAAMDWVSAPEVVDVARRAGVTTADDARDLAVGLIARLILSGLVVAGETTASGFTAWPSSPEASVARIAISWSERSDPYVMPGELFWLAATAEGQRIGEEVLAALPEPD